MPAWVNLHPREDTLANYQPPVHAASPARGTSGLANLRDNLITFAYGHERLLVSPQRVTTDSSGRVIVVDPGASAVHVLGGAHPFRILTGPKRRVQQPSGVATDAEDNIYVADSEQGAIAVFDPSGRFLRYIGKLDANESLFHCPTGIAIDRHTGTLYVLDSERHALFMLDANGNVIRRVGRYANNDRVVEFEYPTEIVANENELAIMDAAGSRVWITDLQGNPLHHFSFAVHEKPEKSDRVGLAMDSGGVIYVRGPGHDLRVYSRDGQLLSAFGHFGSGNGEFGVASGLWIDGQDRLFVADDYNLKVQEFQLSRPEPLMVAAGE